MFVKLGADIGGFASGMAQAKGELRSMEQGAHSALGSIASAFVRPVANITHFISQLGLATFGIQQLVGGAMSLAGAWIASNASMEQTQVAFTGLLHSADAAKTLLKQLWDFAAKTPFEFPQLTAATQKLLGFGFAIQDIIPMLTAIGDAVAGVGGSAEQVDAVTYAFGQMRAVGVAHLEELYQIANTGIPVMKILAQQLGITQAQLMDMVSKGALPADKAIKLLTAGFENMYAGQMINQSNTFNGLLSTLKDNASAALRAFTGPLFDEAKKGLKILGDLVSSDAFQNFALVMGQHVGDAIHAVEGFLSSRLIPAFDFLRQHIDALQPIAQMVGNIFQYNLLEPARNLASAFSGLGDALAPLFAAFGQVDATSALTSLLNTLYYLISPITLLMGVLAQPEFKEGLTRFADVSIPAIAGLVTQFGPLLEGLAALGSDASMIATQIFGNLFPQFLRLAAGILVADVIPTVQTLITIFNDEFVPFVLGLTQSPLIGMLERLVLTLAVAATQVLDVFGPTITWLAQEFIFLSRIVAGNVGPIIDQVTSFLATNLMPIISTLSSLLTGTLLPSIQTLLNDGLMALFHTVSNLLGPALDGATTLINTVLLPALDAISRLVSGAVTPALDMLVQQGLTALGNIFTSLVGPAVATVSTIFQTVLLPSIDAVSQIITNDLIPTFQNFGNGPVVQTIQGMAQTFETVLLPALSQVGNSFQTVILPAILQLMPVVMNLVQVFMNNVVPAAGKIFGILSQFAAFVVAHLMPVINRLVPPIVTVATWIGNGIARAIQFLMPYVVQAVQAFVHFAEGLITRLQPAIEWVVTAISGLVTFIGALWTTFWPSISAVLKYAWDMIVGIIHIAWDIITGIFNIAVDFITGNWGQLWDDVKGMATGLWDDLKGIFQNLWDDVKGIWNSLWDDLKNIGKGAWDGLKGIVEGGINAVIDLINFFIDGINSMGIDVGPVHVHPHIDKIPHVHFAQGGLMATSGLAVVGELGPELVWLPGGARVIPNNALQSAGARLIKSTVSPPADGSEAALDRARGDGFRQTVIIQLDGREMGRKTMNRAAKELRVKGVVK